MVTALDDVLFDHKEPLGTHNFKMLFFDLKSPSTDLECSIQQLNEHLHRFKLEA